MSIFNDDDFSIDRFQLEIEAERNSKLMRKYGKLLGIASAKVKEERRKLNFVETETAEYIRRNPRKFGINDSKKSISDKVAYGIAQNQDNYITQFQIYLQSVRREEDYKNAIDTIRQRGMMIRVLTDQWINNYYSKPVLRGSKKKLLIRKQDDNDLNDSNDDY